MVDGLNIAQRIAQVDLRDPLGAEEDVPDTILIDRPQGDVVNRPAGEWPFVEPDHHDRGGECRGEVEG